MKINWSDIKDTVIGKGVPLLGGLLAGGRGEIAGNLIAQVLGCEASPEAVSNVLENDPDAMYQLRALEASHVQELRKLALEEIRIEQADRASARNREIATVTATGKRDWFLYALAGVFIAGFFILMAMLMLMSVKESSAMMMVIGALVSGVSQVLGYFFGSSKSSTEKTAMLGAKK